MMVACQSVQYTYCCKEFGPVFVHVMWYGFDALVGVLEYRPLSSGQEGNRKGIFGALGLYEQSGMIGFPLA